MLYPAHSRVGLEGRNKNINLSKYLISSSGDRTHNQLRLHSHFVPLRHDRPQIVWSFQYTYTNIRTRLPFRSDKPAPRWLQNIYMK